MSDTTAMPLELLNMASHGHGQPLCPGCRGGRLHPYKVEFPVSVVPGTGWQGSDFLFGFVAVCVGNASYRRDRQKADPGLSADDLGDEVPPCGFSMPLTARRHGG
jgi:hypothetical protein